MNKKARSRDLWSDLPIELLTLIGDRLNTRIDILRLRAVCSSWRSAIPIYNNNTALHLPMELPYAGYPLPLFGAPTSTLTETILYRIEPLDHVNKFDSNADGGWLIKVEEVKPNEFCLLNLDALSKLWFPLDLNLLDYRVFELCKSYVLIEYWKPRKTVFSAEHKALLAIIRGELFFFRLGDEKWTHLANYSSLKTKYRDIIMHKSEFHAIDKFGNLMLINASSLNITQISNPLGYGPDSYRPSIFERSFRDVNDANLMHLLQGFGDLYVVVRPWEKDEEALYYDMELNRNIYSDERYVKKKHAFKIYKFNEEVKDWVKVKSLGNKVIILSGEDSLFASTEELAGFIGNCIYFCGQRSFF